MEVIRLFGLLPCSGDLWKIAADYLQEHGRPVTAAAFRAGVYLPAPVDGDGDGYGSGSGYGDGDGYGYAGRRSE